ncbi:MarR Transcriptional regulators [uncultured Caudovirales phage]|uniref:MarR Transcriptional regulators n=1 Tax=uncultured Caudovirales phage TaxID=2100421 RepID=A0A6J5M282_9CAUD|nr:MarR Transcriptional regulators [uncultured Caudovirales phage]
MAPKPLKALPTLIAALEELRALDEVMPIQQAHALLVIAKRPGLTMQELSDETGLAQSSCSRNVAALSEWHRYGKPGLDLVASEDDPRERRRKVMWLTPKGRTVVGKLMAHLGDDSAPQPFDRRDLFRLT